MERMEGADEDIHPLEQSLYNLVQERISEYEPEPEDLEEASR
jgi:hypothetical protein